MSSPSNAHGKDPVRRLAIGLVVATIAVSVTAAIAFNDRPAPDRRHAPLSETASTWASDSPDALAPGAGPPSAGP